MSRMKVLRISVLLLILAVAIASGCKVAKEITEKAPGTMLGEKPVLEPSEEAVESGLHELNDIDSLEEDLDLGLDELEKMELE